MFDFLKVVKEWDGKKQRYVYSPSFVVKPNIKDLMVRSKGLYAIFDESTGLWETDDTKAILMIDQQVREFAFKDAGDDAMNDESHGPYIKQIADTRNRLIDSWHRFCEKDLRDHWTQLNQKVIFSNTELKRTDYASVRLDYPLQDGITPYYDKLCSVLYSPEEQEKWEWAVGCIIAGDQKKIQKMLVFYGEPGSGKSTIIGKIIADQLLGGYETGYAVKFEANNLAGRDSFATDFLEHDSVLAYDDDAELGIITSKTTLNKIISHEPIRVNCKFKPPFVTNPNCLLIVGSNDPVQMSPNSGMNRRLIDVRPTGNKLDPDTYDECLEHIPFEKSGIAWKCLQVYKHLGRHYYDRYVAEDMLSRTSPFQNFVTENYFQLKDGISLANAYKMYTEYAESCNFKNVLARYKFRDTLKLYFEKYEDMKFTGFKSERIGIKREEPKEDVRDNTVGWLDFSYDTSLFDIQFKDAPAQYASDEGTPLHKWANVKTTLKQLDTRKLHYVKVPVEHIVVDLDIKGKDGKKCFEKNLIAANKFPPTYAELSKSGAGIHLHYIYTGGNPTELSRIYGDNVEIKVFDGNASLRRQLTKCNNLEIAELSSGLPIKEGGKDKVVDWEGFKNEKILRAMIIKNLQKKYHGATKPSIDYISKLLSDAYTSGAHYDVRDLQNDCLAFALNSTHHADYCVAAVNVMHFCSKDAENDGIPDVDNDARSKAPIIFLDIEVSPNYKQALEEGAEIPDDIPKDSPAHFLINWKYMDDDPYQFTEDGKVIMENHTIKPVVRMIDPTPQEVENLIDPEKFRIIGHNVNGYDAHMLYARAQGYTIDELYNLSKRIISGDKKAQFNEAKKIPYADTLDFAAGNNKQGLKKWEIKFGFNHLEWNLPWNVPVPKDKLGFWAEYCDNDVISCEMLFNYLQPDFEAREMLAAMSGLSLNTSTNNHTIGILTHDIKNPQDQFVYTDLSEIFPGYEFDELGIDKSRYNEGAKIVSGKSIYRGEDPGEGGHKIGYPGIYYNVALLDVASMHPHSAIALNLFGDVITKRYAALVEARVNVKHIKEVGDEAYNNAIILMDQIKEGCGATIEGVLKGLSGKELKAKCKAIANALKTAINSVYGLTSAKFPNKLRDPRNVDNIVAKRGALFMINLKHELWDRGFKVAHVSTDSIKIPDATPEIIDFVMNYGKQYGYTFEHEATYAKMCLVDDTNYIAYEVEADGQKLEDPFWTATGKKFAVPYIFKTLFSHEEIIFEDMCETISVKEGSLHLINDEGDEDVFVGRVGQFTPVVKDGLSLYRVKDGKLFAASGTKGYKWLESETVQARQLENYIDRDYYRIKCDEVIDTISKYGSFDDFVSESYKAPIIFDAMNPPIPDTDKDELPWDEYVKGV